jgi:hypothetical protein
MNPSTDMPRSLLLPTPVDQQLRFTHGNSKLPNSTMILSLPAGHTCPGANECLARVPRHGGPAVLGPYNSFVCYAASQERYRKTVRDVRWRNLDILAKYHNPIGMAAELFTAFFHQHRSYTRRVRLFESGDAFSRSLSEGITMFAREIQPLVVYLYTKNLPVWIDLDIPSNLYITASWGGRYDGSLIPRHFPRNARVVQDEAEAAEIGIPIDFDDSHAYTGEPHAFAHLVHGWQPAGTPAADAINRRRKAGRFTGYGSTFSPAQHAPL